METDISERKCLQGALPRLPVLEIFDLIIDCSLRIVERASLNTDSMSVALIVMHCYEYICSYTHWE